MTSFQGSVGRLSTEWRLRRLYRRRGGGAAGAARGEWLLTAAEGVGDRGRGEGKPPLGDDMGQK